MRRLLPRSVASHFSAFLAGLLVAGGTIAHSVPGDRANEQRFAALDAFAQSLALVTRSHVDAVSERRLLYGAISGMVGELDPHSAFYTPAQYTRLRQDTEGEFGGVGVSLGEGQGGEHPVIEVVVPNSPAARAGLQAGDVVLKVGDASTAKNKSDTPDGPVAPVAWHSRLRGATGTRVILHIARASWSAPRSLTLVRERIAVPSVETARYGNIAHIRIRRFREATSRDLYKAVHSELKEPNTRLILDLRGNPGGLLDKGIEVADQFLERGIIVSVVSRGSAAEVARAHKARTFTEVPMVVLVDQNTASASEIVAAALQDAGRAQIIGVPTYGKGSVQSFLDLRDGSGLKLTTSRYLTPSGATLEGVGIQPDIQVEAFAALVVSPGASTSTAPSGSPEAALNGLSSVQKALLSDDPQLLKGFQVLRN